MNAFGNAIGESVAAGMQSGYNTPAGGEAADYRNGMDVDSDNATAQREAMYGLGGMGARLGASRANLGQVWGQMTNDSIECGARAWGNWETASQARWSAQDAQAEAEWQRGAPARNARADAYGRELAMADIANESQRMANRAAALTLRAPTAYAGNGGFFNEWEGAGAFKGDGIIQTRNIVTPGRIALEKGAGWLLGGAKSVWHGVDTTVRVAGNAVLMIGDFLTGGMNRDSDIIQQARIEMGALAYSVLNPGETWGGIKTSFSSRADAAIELRAQGRYFDAATYEGEMFADGAQMGLGLYGAARGIKFLGTRAIENAFTGHVAGSMRAQRGAIDLGPDAHVMGPNDGPQLPRAYSVAYEMTLAPADFGRSRSVHFNRGNAALDSAVQRDADLAGLLEGEIPGLTASVSSVGGRANPPGWTWEHASTSTAFGQQGVLRLVPTNQHTPGSVWWRVLHPDAGAAGGYSEWAIPNGAPKPKQR